MRLVYITLARKNLCYGSFPAKVSLGTNAYNSQSKIALQEPAFQIQQPQFRERRTGGDFFCPHLTFGAIPLFMRVWRQPKIRALNFKICALYFKIQGTYFFFAAKHEFTYGKT